MDWKSKIFGLSLLTCLISCEDGFETGYTGRGDGSLRIIATAPSGYMQTRAADELDAFIDGTKFYLYATKTTDSGEDWDINYLLKNPNPDPAKQDALAVGVADADEKLGNAVRITAYTNDDNPEYEELYSIASKFNEKPLNLYGIVAASNSQEEREELEAELSRSQYTFYRNEGKPAASLISHESEDETYSNKPLPDIMWSGSVKNYTPFEYSGDIVMPFFHVLSKLRFHAIYLDNEVTAENEIVITGLKLKDYKKGLLNFANGLFDYNYDDSNTNMQRNGWIDISIPEEGVEPTSKQSLEEDENGTDSGNQLDPFSLPDPFAIARIFPTYNTSYDNKFDADLTDGTPGVPVGSLQNGDISDAHAVYIEVTYTMGGKNLQLSVPLKNVGKNFAFAPNHQYDIVLTFTTESVVVAIMPLYYDYIGKELPLDDYELGEPIDFGGVLWAAENLGATSADPTASAEAWERARGFYYQYGRNIPYYARGSVWDPYPEVVATNEWDNDIPHTLYNLSPDGREDNVYIPSSSDERGEYGTKHGHGARAYPYIPALWEKEIEDEDGDKNAGYVNFLAKYRFYSEKITNGQSEPSKNFSDPYIADYIISDPNTYPPNSVAYSAYYPGNWQYARYWNRDEEMPQNWDLSTSMSNESDPCPKGWRLPTRAEFLSIFPYDHRCGDITFSPGWMDNKGNNGDARAFGKYEDVENPFDDHQKNGYFADPVAANATDGDYKGLESIYVGIYKDGEGYNDLMEEHRKYDEVEEDEFVVDIPQEGWGSIYCIKCAGTEEAYAIRWQIKIVGYDPMTDTFTEANVNPPHQHTYSKGNFRGRGVVVISKYELGQDRRHAYLHHRELTDGEKAAYNHLPEEKRPDRKCIVFSNEGKNLTWNQYDAEESEEIKIDWNHPDGVMYLPIPGYIIMTSSGMQALLYSGREAIYWAADNGSNNDNGHFGSAVRIKFSGDYASRFMYNTLDEYIANGGNIRCVRDTRADLN